MLELLIMASCRKHWFSAESLAMRRPGRSRDWTETVVLKGLMSTITIVETDNDHNQCDGLKNEL